MMSRSSLFGKAQIIVGDKTSHGGVVLEGSPTNTWHGIPVARKGDKVSCPRCKPHIFLIAEGLENCTDTNAALPLAAEGHKTNCGAELIAKTAPAHWVSAANSLLNAEKSIYNEQLQVIDNSGNPLAGVAYFIEGDGGAIFYGDTAADGKCPRLGTEDAKPLKVWFGLSAIQKMNEAKK